MNREIKFRVWDHKLGKFVHEYRLGQIVESDRFGFSKTVLPINFNENVIDYNINNIVCQQFTGFKDTNGKEIYEGDIVRICVDDNPEDPQWELIPITFEWGSFWVGKDIMAEFVTSQMEAGLYHLFDLEVIGNIFENPELLK